MDRSEDIEMEVTGGIGIVELYPLPHYAGISLLKDMQTTALGNDCDNPRLKAGPRRCS